MEETDTGGSYGSTEHHTRGRRTRKIKGSSKKTDAVSSHKQASQGAFQGKPEPGRPRPKTSGGIVRQLILQAENQLAQKRSDIEFLETQLQQLREMLAEWESGVSAINSENSDQHEPK